MPAVSVLAAMQNPGPILPGFVRSVDAQTLPSTEFELVVVDSGSDGSADRLRLLAARRPNVTALVADADASEADRLALALEQATGEYVLVVRQQQRLAPRALELLLDRARRTGAGLVVGRAVTATTSGCAALRDDADELDPSELDLTGCLVMVRRSLLAGGPQGGADLVDSTGLARAAGSIGAVSRYACATEEGAPTVPSEAVALDQPTYRWSDGALHVAARVRLSAPASPAPGAWLVVAHGTAEVALPLTAVADEQDPTALALSAVLDPRTAEGGHPLDDGPWALAVRIVQSDREATLALPPGASRAAVIAGRPYVAGAADGALAIDAGATRRSVIGRVSESGASVVESVHGALVTLDHPELHVHGDAALDARLLLGGFSLPARLVCRDGRARSEAYVGSLAGVSAVSVLAGGGKPVPTGLRLRVDGSGGMTFERVPAPKPGAPAGSTAGGAPLVQRLRRRLPGAMDPLVLRLSRVPALRSAYRRLLSR